MILGLTMSLCQLWDGTVADSFTVLAFLGSAVPFYRLPFGHLGSSTTIVPGLWLLPYRMLVFIVVFSIFCLGGATGGLLQGAIQGFRGYMLKRSPLNPGKAPAIAYPSLPRNCGLCDTHIGET